MANLLLTEENFVDSTYYDVVIHGGSTGAWSNTLPLSNLAVDDLSQAAQSVTASEDDTQFQVDLGVTRNVSLIAIPSTNGTSSGTVIIDASNTPVFSGVTVGANASIGDTTVYFETQATPATIGIGDVFTINGFTYRSASNIYIPEHSTDFIFLDTTVSGFGYPELQTNITTGMTVECNTGDFDYSSVYDSGSISVIPRIFEFGELKFGDPRFWTGKPTEEERRRNIYPVVLIPDTTVLARFWRVRFSDTTNAVGFLRLPRLFLASTIQPTVNASWGAGIGLQTETVRETSLGSIDTYDVKENRRIQNFVLENLPVNEALSRILDTQKRLGINVQTFFVFDPEDTVHMHRRAFTATLNNLNLLLYPYHDRMNAAGVEVREVLGGNMN